MTTLSMRLDDALDAKLSREAQRTKKSRSELARQAIDTYLDERERQRFIDDIARAARALDPIEGRMLAQEALPLDNEALILTEDPSTRRPVRTRTGSRP